MKLRTIQLLSVIHTYSAFLILIRLWQSEEERLLLNMVLQLWIAIRITTRSIRICGEETLGMPRNILDETSPLRGEIPIPPVMGAQIELILRSIQIPLRKKVLNQLQTLILEKKPHTWFTIYLCSFILLHNCAMMTKHDAGYARKHGLQVCNFLLHFLPGLSYLLFRVTRGQPWLKSITLEPMFCWLTGIIPIKIHKPFLQAAAPQNFMPWLS